MSSKFVFALFAGLSFLAAGPALADEGDPQAGKRVFNQCMACHTVEKGKHKPIGPSLHGVIGRKAGTAEGFKNYSPAMQKSGITWTEETLEKYLANPKKIVPGTRMVFNGLKKEDDRENVIAYIKQASQQ